MAHPLGGAVAKLNRAREQIDGLNRSFSAAIEGRTYRLVVGEPFQTGFHALRLASGQAFVPSLDWSAVIGEIAHDLRSGLDLLACELALLKPDPVSLRDISFPIRIFGAKARAGPRKPRWHAGLVTPFKREHGAQIKRLQPYHRTKGGRRNPLWLLQKLNNADKHRAIQTTQVRVRGATPRTLTLTRDPDDGPDTAIVRGFGMDTSEIQENVPLRDEARVGWIDATVSPQGSVAMDIKIHAKVILLKDANRSKGLRSYACW